VKASSHQQTSTPESSREGPRSTKHSASLAAAAALLALMDSRRGRPAGALPLSGRHPLAALHAPHLPPCPAGASSKTTPAAEAAARGRPAQKRGLRGRPALRGPRLRMEGVGHPRRQCRIADSTCRDARLLAISGLSFLHMHVAGGMHCARLPHLAGAPPPTAAPPQASPPSGAGRHTQVWRQQRMCAAGSAGRAAAGRPRKGGDRGTSDGITCIAVLAQAAQRWDCAAKHTRLPDPPCLAEHAPLPCRPSPRLRSRHQRCW
jgi:hypothetical protein